MKEPSSMERNKLLYPKLGPDFQIPKINKMPKQDLQEKDMALANTKKDSKFKLDPLPKRDFKPEVGPKSLGTSFFKEAAMTPPPPPELSAEPVIREAQQQAYEVQLRDWRKQREIESNRTPEEAASERARLELLNKSVAENRAAKAAELENLNRIAAEKKATELALAKKEADRQALRARLEATADKAMAEYDEEEKKENTPFAKLKANLKAQVQAKKQERAELAALSEDIAKLKAKRKEEEDEEVRVKALDEELARAVAERDRQALDEQAILDLEAKIREQGKPKIISADREDGFAGLGKPDEDWAAAIPRAIAPEGKRAAGKGRDDMVKTETGIEAKDRILADKYVAVKQAERNYAAAYKALKPGKFVAEMDDASIADVPPPFLMFGIGKKELVRLHGQVKAARAQILPEDLNRFRASEQNSSSSANGAKPLDGTDPITFNERRAAQAREKDAKASKKKTEINSEVDAFLDEQGVPRGEHGKREEMELTLKEIRPRLNAAIKAYAEAYRLVDKSLADQLDDYFYLKLPPKVGVLSSNKDEKRKLNNLYQAMSELNGLYEQAQWAARLEKEKNKSK